LHISAYAIAYFSISAHFVQRKHAHVSFTPHISVMPHICSIYAAYFAKFRIFCTKTAHIF